MKKKLTVFEKIEQTNKQYATSSKKEKVVMLAQDVIALLKDKKLITKTQGPFCNLPEVSFPNLHLFDKSLKNVLPNVQCQVCGLGSIFVAHVARTNKVETKGDYGFNSMSNRLKRLMGVKLFRQVEIAYEKGNGWFRIYENDETGKKDYDAASANFGKKYESNDKRLIAIMKNIIKNEGEFVP